jgi:pyridoxine/pyridoxamine 5'-phosphate oxidase
MIQDFLKLVRTNGRTQGLTFANRSVQSHLTAFAAEESRIEGNIVHLQELIKRFGMRQDKRESKI